MITAVSITLYGAAVFFGVAFGCLAEQFKKGEPNKEQGKFVVVICCLSFLMAVALQVWA
jgi:hypothetical protein